MENAYVTIFENPSGIDKDTGYRTKDADPSVLLRDARCVYAPERSSRRRVGQDGMRESVESVPSLMIETDETLRMGMVADVTPDGDFPTQRFQVTRAVRDSGISGSEWILELQAIETPA